MVRGVKCRGGTKDYEQVHTARQWVWREGSSRAGRGSKAKSNVDYGIINYDECFLVRQLMNYAFCSVNR